MRRIAIVCMGLAGAACRDAPEAPPPAEQAEAPKEETPERQDPFRELNWTAVSQDGTAALTQTHVGGGKCRRSCTDAPAGKEVWSADGCMAKQLDLRFVSNDCERAAVLHQLPSVESGQSWREVTVARVYERARLAYPVEAAGAVRDFKKVRSAGSTFYWLKGVLGQPGSPPRYSADGASVEFVTLDGNPQKIPLTK